MKKNTKTQQLNLQLPPSSSAGEVSLPNASSKALACKPQAELNVVTPETGSDENDSEETETEPSRRNVISQSKDITVRELSMLHHEQDLILQPFYQRNFVVTRQVASRLVESLLLDIPIPAVFLSEEQDGTFSVIDGQQRLTSLISFLNGKFPDDTVFRLSGLKVLTDINKMGFEQLDKRQQRKIKNATLHTITFNKESNEEIKFDIFERYNTGVTSLNDDEIRNAIYRGPFIDLLKDLSNNEIFHELLQQEGYRKRMKDRGLILRFLSLTEKTYMNYGPPMKLFLNKELRDNRYIDPDKAAEFRKSFKHCLDMVKAVFGENAFRRYKGSDDPKQLHTWSRKFNTALFDLQMCGFAYYTKHQVMSKADEIREAMIDLMVKNDEFIDAIEHKIDNKSVLQKRFKIWYDTIAAIIGPGAPQKRSFSYSIKEALFKQHPYCAISGQRILSIDDAEVDHKVSWKDGGPTTLENAQLVLRYFNREKGSKSDFDTASSVELQAT